jgi:hypothetical protein
VTFTIDGTPQAPIALQVVNGQAQATLSTAALAVGLHTVAASYGGNPTFAASAATPVTVTVTPIATATRLFASSNPSTSGQAVTFTAPIGFAPGGGLPTGTVTFTIDGVPQSRVGLVRVGNAFEATFTTTLTPGTHTIIASYSGDAFFASSTSTTLVQVVQSAPNGDGPTVTAVQRFGFHAMPTTVVLTFSTALDPARAQDVSNYRIITLGGPGRGGKRVGHRVAVHQVVYDPTAHTVTLHPAEPLDVHNRYELTVAGTGPTGLADTSGRLLDGKKTGMPGSDYVTVISFATLAGFPPETAKPSPRPVRKPSGLPTGPAAAFRLVRYQWATGPKLVPGFPATPAPQ